MIIVTGATGQLGPLIVKALLEHLPADRIGASARDPGKAAVLAASGVRVRHGDYSDESSLRSAFEGAEQVLMVSSNAAASGGDAIGQHRTAIAAAKAAGVRRIVYTSQMSASHGSAFPPGRDHAATEDLLRDSGLRWTALRHGFYAASALRMIGDYATTGAIAAPQDGKASWVAHADLAKADAAILADEGRFEGPTPPLTGSEALDFADLAAIASDVLGRDIRREIIGDEAVRAGMNARNLPHTMIEIALGMYEASRAGEFAAVDPTLGQLIGQRPRTMRDVLEEHVARPKALAD